MSKEAMKLALEAAYLAGFNASGEGYNGEYPFGDHARNPEEDAAWIKDRDNALRKALTSIPDWASEAKEKPPQQEPVAWFCKEHGEVDTIWSRQQPPWEGLWKPLYTSPQPQRKPLTDHQTMSMTFNHHWLTSMTLRDAYRLGIRDAEAAHGIKGDA